MSGTKLRVLAIDTSTELLSVCLDTGGGRVEALLDIGLTHAERVMDLVGFCLERSGLERRDIDLIACTEGPGSFTGLRIGMSAAKGLALGLGKPWIAIPTLDCLAWGLELLPGAVVPVIDGKKGRFYAAIYVRGQRQGPWLDAPLASLVALFDNYARVTVTGPDARCFEELAMERSAIRIDPRARLGAARGLAVLAAEAFAERGASSDETAPLYLRPSEAEETADRKSGEAKTGLIKTDGEGAL